ncbi:XRE family transcriptional regulator [Loktanella sp. IMCC34160]|uniref:helix-turn-helix transcriptional regulator n=1 Tax=Loktanella sp. IMCC34160 TaxID=2510646 RepID=UPI00101DD3BD|nr:helix-turn-helix transcriptional regulator [Loktanella sp. IMCC34160]RYG93322.1 XRE family transcriptional regulator [Loktanella sp. IMCC34160]
MTGRQLTGTRIRERRIDVGMRQTALAQAVGISGSYLNLIEHNRRRIGGRLLNEIARALDVDPAQLTSGAESAVLDQLRVAASADPDAGAELARAEEFAGRFPGWAALAAGQARRIDMLESRVAALTDRLAHDPQLATSLHQVISAVTSIRSAASILAGADELDHDWQNRFHRNIYEDSQRLADSSRALVRFLDMPEDQGGAALTPVEEVEQWLDGQGWHLPAIEEAAATGADPGEAVSALVKGAGLASPAASTMLSSYLTRALADARLLPLTTITQLLAATRDPAELAARAGVPFDVVLRRLAVLPAGVLGHTPGLVIADAAGAIGLQRAGVAVALPRGGVACPLWPIFGALGQPGQPIRATVVLPGDPVQHVQCFAIATRRGPPRFDAPPVIEAVMVFWPRSAPSDSGGAGVVPVGTSCRICPRGDCAYRREPSILPEVGLG